MVPHKKTGKEAVWETRHDAAEAAELRDEPKHEVTRPGDTFVKDGMQTLHPPAAHNHDDIRIVVPDGDGGYLYQGPWNKSQFKADMESAWDKANA